MDQQPPAESFPRQQARSRRFTLGAPRSFSVSADGSRVLFVRSRGGADPVGCLWALDVATGDEHLLVDPLALLGDGEEDLSSEEKTRRERARETASGVVSYLTDDDARIAVLPLSGRLFTVPTDGSRPPVELTVAGPVLDPRPSPDGALIAYVSVGALRVCAADGSEDRALVEPDGPDITYGLAEFVAAEEMDRTRGYWWAPDSDRLLVARVDESPVAQWWIADPANPDRAPQAVRYPAAGTADACVTLAIVGLDGARLQVEWDRDALPYLVRASWTTGGLVLQVFSRDQQRAVTLAVDPTTGSTSALREDTDPAWVDAILGAPTLLDDGRLLHCVAHADANALAIDGSVLTPDGLDVSVVLRTESDVVVFLGSDDPLLTHLFSVSLEGNLTRLSSGDGVHVGISRSGTTVLTSATLSAPLASTSVTASGRAPIEVANLALTPSVKPAPEILLAGPREIRTALLLPTDWEPSDGPLPVLMDPYGGPHGRRVAAAAGLFRESQWWADQGFAVVVADGRGTPGRGRAWDREVRLDLATAPLDDQVEALHAVAELHPELDLTRVAIRGWSFGGYLSALAVLRRPDVFHAAIAGAPVTDFALYDTFYTERYLGHPDEQPDAYHRSSLLPLAGGLTRPLLLVHGLADDNVVAAHTLRLSSVLLAAGRPHQMLPLSGVTHMTPQVEVAENLLLLQRDFLRQALGLA